jgi:hypothetical protein
VPAPFRITDVLAGIPLVSVMTATVTIRGDEARERSGWLRQASPVAAIVPRSQVARHGLCACSDYHVQRTKLPRAKRGSFEKEIHS